VLRLRLAYFIIHSFISSPAEVNGTAVKYLQEFRIRSDIADTQVTSQAVSSGADADMAAKESL